MSEPKLNRRAFLKALAAGGVSATLLPTLAQAAPQAGIGVQPEPLAQGAPPDTKAVYIYTKGPMGNLGWKNGDTLPWLPAVEFPAGPATDAFAALGKDKILTAYRRMFTNYRWETAIKDLNVEGKEAIGSGHMYIGMEASSCGVTAALNPDDLIAATHRGHGALIAKDGDVNKMMAEFFAKTSGYNKGFGGSMHLTDMSRGIMGMNGIVGAGWYIIAGAAIAIQVKGEKKVAVAFAGDGAANSVWFFSAVRNAVNYKLPAIFVVENNFYNISVPAAAVVPTKRVSDYVAGLDIPHVTVDGNNIAEVYYATKQAVDRARAGQGPSVIETQTFRWYDHSGFAGAKLGVDAAFGLPYRSDDEVKQWMTRAPWLRLANFVTSKNIATKDELAAIEKDVQAKVDASIAFAKQGQYPAADEALKAGYVYSKTAVPPRQFIDGVVPAEFKAKATDKNEFERIVDLYYKTGSYMS